MRYFLLAQLIFGCGTLALLLLLGGCSSPGELSPVAYDSAKALFSICNRKDSEALAKLKAQIDESLATEVISAAEAKQLRQVVVAAEGGNWERGQDRARSLLERQQSRTPKAGVENQVSEPRGGSRRK